MIFNQIFRLYRLIFPYQSIYNPTIYDLTKPRFYEIALPDGSIMTVTEEDFGFSPYIQESQKEESVFCSHTEEMSFSDDFFPAHSSHSYSSSMYWDGGGFD